ncbi:endonuclease/exonuclease/phosphatase family protein [Gossypium australe]|uniref:Endonuclease/exonuclease/phosphatase family protein n=1 Tax=Gossypium australe TaxID=47621 RepID=A0A5B6UNR6_9ROSI|nr:endonuclease/exonuclease/phosphatase family protein [Gossypium australe]
MHPDKALGPTKPTSMKDLRLIALCNIVYKLVVKVLTNCLKIFHLITDNVMVAFETIHNMKNKGRGLMGEIALKVDISKAYDMVDWIFLHFILERLGFITDE